MNPYNRPCIPGLQALRTEFGGAPVTATGNLLKNLSALSLALLPVRILSHERLYPKCSITSLIIFWFAFGFFWFARQTWSSVEITTRDILDKIDVFLVEQYSCISMLSFPDILGFKVLNYRFFQLIIGSDQKYFVLSKWLLRNHMY